MSERSQEPIEGYEGFEQGPIRPPSEASSLLIRLTRNCPWNRCTFCPVYKGEKFSIRPVECVKEDIDTVYRYVEMLREGCEHPQVLLRQLRGGDEPGQAEAFAAAYNWFHSGRMRSIFLQDANSLIMKPKDLVEVLTNLRSRFPEVKRVTSYARSHTLANRSDEDLQAICEAGLNRIHIGLESGSDEVLKRISKGSTKEQHIEAGLKVKRAGMEVSEYVMPGLGGRELSEEHALESADALNQIDPDFIRLRTLAIPRDVPLYEEFAAGRFAKCTDEEVVREVRVFLGALDGISSALQSDHILNLLGELEGQLPEDKERMLAQVDEFLALSAKDKMLYQVGRRTGTLRSMEDLEVPQRQAQVEAACREFGVTPENVDEMLDEIMRRFI